MIKRTIYIGNPAYLQLKNAQLQVEYPDDVQETKSVPVEDIGMLVLDHQQITITHGLVNALIEKNAAMLWCDWRHLPHGLLLSTNANNTYTEKVRAQLDASEPLKKQLWRQTVRAKILNQAANLDYFGHDGGALRKIAGKVGSGDPENMEGRAAARYWDTLLARYYVTRGRDEGGPNLLLNYGYAILRAIAARSLAASGCLTAMGIHHSNKYNPHCLADDIMEPYRPIVDYYVFSYLAELDHQPPEELQKEHKARLLKIPVLDIRIREKNSPLMVGMQHTTAGLMQCFEGIARKIPYPNIEYVHANSTGDVV